MITQKQHARQYTLHKSEYDNVYNDIMENGLDTNGPYAKKCREKIKSITGRKHVFMTNSGTAAITAGIYALDLFDKKVAVGSYNYVACVNQIKAFCKPVFIDCDENTLIDINRIPNDCDAVMLVNYWGNIVNYNQIAKKFKGKIITDCSQSFGSTYMGKNDGYFGDVSIFAFGGQKPIGTRGFTGAIATDEDRIARRIDCAINQGKFGERRDMPTEMLGFRGASQELQCGILSVGMKYWEKWLRKRKRIAKRIIKSLQNYPMRFLKGHEFCESSYYRIVFEIDNMNDFVSYMKEHGIDAQSSFIDDFNQIWGTTRTKMPMTQKMISRVASLPLSPFFTEDEIEKIIKSVKDYFKQG